MRLALLPLALVLACNAPEPAAVAPAVARGIHAEWTKNAVIYEVNIRQYTAEGTFAAFTKEIPRIKSLGVDILAFDHAWPREHKNWYTLRPDGSISRAIDDKGMGKNNVPAYVLSATVKGGMQLLYS